MFRATRALYSRSAWKGKGLDVQDLPIVKPKPGEDPPPIKTQHRSATILPNFVGLRFQVHNGKIYQEVRITEEMVGHKLGEFSATRKRFSYRQSKNK
ncbi:ribosomal protein S19 [Saccharata proteae CBS 121410]|uniref:Ribosomal protein S19 n=1 Tax=Saccharata proteae CBS 121410 TaxID=1314787 RepID=A0A6A5YC27_9PEZI|nr:ribosomal protein S19 [Saccharata proteae CBS 121410]